MTQDADYPDRLLTKEAAPRARARTEAPENTTQHPRKNPTDQRNEGFDETLYMKKLSCSFDNLLQDEARDTPVRDVFEGYREN